jgi:hypothetical protein
MPYELSLMTCFNQRFMARFVLKLDKIFNFDVL